MAKRVLSIAGSDTWSGGGIQTDLKTFDNLHTFGLSVITCIAIEENGQFMIRPLPLELTKEQLQTIENSFTLDAVKIGLLADISTIDYILSFLKIKKEKFPVVLDPVLAFKESSSQYQDSYVDKIMSLAEYATILTPNLTEAKLLAGLAAIENITQMKQACLNIFAKSQCPVVIKGRDCISKEKAFDLFYDGNNFQLLEGPVAKKKTVNGAGCCFSSAICAFLAQGCSLEKAIAKSKKFVYRAIENGLFIDSQTGNVWYTGSCEQ